MSLPDTYTVEGLSGERFRVVYHLTGNEQDARQQAEAICLEQTVEFPGDLLPDGDIPAQIVGRIEDFGPVETGKFAATISYANETAGSEFPQLLNVIFGNSSIKPGIRVERLELSPRILAGFKGPRFGQAGWRKLLDIDERPLLCTALKPMGLSVDELAKLAYEFALGGIDIIKDDHGLANQAFAPFQERVGRCAEAVEKANRETGLRCMYAPNITAPADKILGRARFAKHAGAGALMLCPGLTGMDAMRLIASNNAIGLPILSHPAFQGNFVTSPDSGISHYALYGQMMRLAGADATIFPNYGGRFSFSRAECQSIAEGCAVPMGRLKPIFPAPGGGMSLDRVADMHGVYGREVMYLIGGDLHRYGDLVESARRFVDAVRGL